MKKTMNFKNWLLSSVLCLSMAALLLLLLVIAGGASRECPQCHKKSRAVDVRHAVVLCPYCLYELSNDNEQ